jgi:hypothetical protein
LTSMTTMWILAANMISPIADNAFNYYDFKLEGGTFNDENNQTINKVKSSQNVITNRIWGYIYIVKDSWAIYAIDLDIKAIEWKKSLLIQWLSNKTSAIIKQ